MNLALHGEEDEGRAPKPGTARPSPLHHETGYQCFKLLRLAGAVATLGAGVGRGAADGEPVVLVLLLAGATVPPVEAEEMRSALGSGCHGRVPARTVALLAHQFAHAQHVAHRRAWRSRARGGTLLAKRIIWFVSTRYIC